MFKKKNKNPKKKKKKTKKKKKKNGWRSGNGTINLLNQKIEI